MSDSDKMSERRLAENQQFFKQKNEEVPKALEALKESATSEGHELIVQNIDIPLKFYCECADENCKKRITLKPSVYKELHQNSDQFVLLPGHHTFSIERVMSSNKNFIVVEKYITRPPRAEKLNPTDVDNS